MIPNPYDIEYFVEVAHTNNLTRAAERIGITQPSLSQSMQRLENTIGAQLLLRSKKGVSLTPAGRQLLKYSKKLINDWEQIKLETLSANDDIKGQLRFGCHASVGTYTLCHFLPEVLNQNTDLEFILKHDLSRKITEQIIGLQIDMGIVVNPVRHADLIIHKLFTDEVTFFASTTHAKINTNILIYDPNLMQSQSLLKKCKQSKMNFRRMITSSSLENIVTLVKEGGGIGILPTRVVNAFAAKGLKKIKGTPIFIDEIALVYRVENKNIRSVSYVKEMILKAFKSNAA